VAADQATVADLPGVPQPAVWEFAGLLLSYWCSARCAFCYVNAGPQQCDWMSVATAIGLWRDLDRLAASRGKSMRIHLAGGEPFGNWPRLVAILRAARDAGLSTPEKVETNAFWASSDGLTRTRLELLASLGVQRLVVSTDVFHQEFVPFDHVRRCVEIGRQIFGCDRLRVRWWDFYHDPLDTSSLAEEQKNAAFLAALRRHAERLNGRAARLLAPLLPCRPADAFGREHCRREILCSRHVHIDPAGHVFPGTCAGLALGRVRTAEESTASAVPSFPSVMHLWEHWTDYRNANTVIGALLVGGSHELMRLAIGLGYRPRPQGYADKCHLCADIRQWAFESGLWPDCVAPAACYRSPPVTERTADRPPAQA